MAKAKMPHEGHGKHLCYLVNMGYQIGHPAEYKKMVKDAAYVCKICGRAASDKTSLCKPAKI